MATFKLVIPSVGESMCDITRTVYTAGGHYYWPHSCLTNLSCSLLNYHVVDFEARA